MTRGTVVVHGDDVYPRAQDLKKMDGWIPPQIDDRLDFPSTLRGAPRDDAAEADNEGHDPSAISREIGLPLYIHIHRPSAIPSQQEIIIFRMHDDGSADLGVAYALGAHIQSSFREGFAAGSWSNGCRVPSSRERGHARPCGTASCTCASPTAARWRLPVCDSGVEACRAVSGSAASPQRALCS
jgi:hypothetical protein